MTRLGRLKSVEATVNGTQDTPPAFRPQHERTMSAHQPLAGIHEWGSHTSDLSFDKHFIIAHANPTCWQFLGSSSAFSLAVEVLVHASAKFGQLSHPENYAGPEFWLDAQPPEDFENVTFRSTPSQTEISSLVSYYLSTTNLMMQFFDPDDLARDVEAYQQNHGSYVQALTGKDAHGFFRISMICAIAAANKARHHSSYATESMAYYAEGLQCVEEVTSDVSADALQALLLLIQFALFYPRKGDIWKLLDFACRLSVELNYHSETNDQYESEKEKKLRRSLFWGLYCIERTIGQHLGRPSDLPEEIITAEYPATLNEVNLDDPMKSQFALTSHYYRLTYLRSEIFRELYMPAVAPNLSRSWYEQRLEHILAWRKELHFLDNMSGMGSMTCDMGFDTSVCFLFQPLLLRALVATKEGSLDPDFTVNVPRESYESACGVVDFYTKVFRGKENTPYGMYPITVISAHYVHQATLTIMAHCLLALDGRLPIVSFSNELSGGATGAIDFDNIHGVNSNCLILLTTLAKKWPGMVGVLDTYKSLQDRILPIMNRVGLT